VPALLLHRCGAEHSGNEPTLSSHRFRRIAEILKTKPTARRRTGLAGRDLQVRPATLTVPPWEVPPEQSLTAWTCRRRLGPVRKTNSLLDDE